MSETPEMPDFIRRAIEAQGKVDPDEVLDRIHHDAQVIPPDEVEVRAEHWRDELPDGATIEGPEETHDMTEQAALWGDSPTPISYETLLSPTDVATYKRVKATTMRIADDAREICCRLVNGKIGDGGRSGKQFLQTGRGKFRLATSTQSDNSTEVAAHERMGVATIHLSEPEEMIAWFALHDLPGRLSYDKLVRDLRSRYQT